MTWTLPLLLSYLVGGIPWSWLAGRLIGGIDLRRVGSGNLGATNTYRALGARVAIPVLVLDVLKGYAAPALCARLAGPGPFAPATHATLCGLLAILGHMFSPYLGLRGGKGVATAAGVFAALEPIALLVALAVFVLAFALSGGIVSVGSLLASIALPVAMRVARGGDIDRARLALVAALVVLVWVKHTANIGRLRRGQEPSLLSRRRGALAARAAGGAGDAGAARKESA